MTKHIKQNDLQWSDCTSCSSLTVSEITHFNAVQCVSHSVVVSYIPYSFTFYTQSTVVQVHIQYTFVEAPFPEIQCEVMLETFI